MYEQGIPSLDLFIEQDTERTPEPQKYYVIYKGQIIGNYKKLNAANKKYSEVKTELGYTSPSYSKLNSEDITKAVTEEWMDRTQLYWLDSKGYRKKSR
jgi:hypothetical protein